MPIIIKNVSKPSGDGKCICKYHVHINDKLICEFTHIQEYGLAECLAKASKAVELHKFVKAAEMLGVI